MTMNAINVYEAKTQLSRLLERVEAGEEIIITRHGRPVARLGPVTKRTQPRRLGRLKGKIRTRKGFDAPLPEEMLAAFEGTSI
jgi:prevent-host-death family protein